MEDLTQGSVTKHLLRFCSGTSCGKGFASTNRKISFLPRDGIVVFLHFNGALLWFV